MGERQREREISVKLVKVKLNYFETRFGNGTSLGGKINLVLKATFFVKKFRIFSLILGLFLNVNFFQERYR